MLKKIILLLITVLAPVTSLTLVFSFLSPIKAQAVTHNLTDSANYNIRYDGADSLLRLGNGRSLSVDLNNNGLNDLVVASPDEPLENHYGYVYVIYDDTLAAHSGNIDLNDPSNYDIRYNGGNQSGNLGAGGIKVGDFDGDDLPDLVINENRASYYSTLEGAIYIVYNTTLQTQSGNVSFVGSANYDHIIIGPVDGDFLGAPTGQGFKIADLDNDGEDDLIVGDHSSYGASGTGSLYVIYNTLISAYGTKLVRLEPTGTPSNDNFNIRFDGSADYDACGDGGSYSGFDVGYVDDDNLADLVVSCVGMDQGNSGSGSVFVIYDDKIATYTGRGNVDTLDETDLSNVDIMYYGAEASSRLGGTEVFIVDIDNDGANDLVLGSDAWTSATLAGSVYVIDSSLISGHSGAVSLGTATNYSIRYDGVVAGSYASGDVLAYAMLDIADFDGNGLYDIGMGSHQSDNNGTNTGSVWIVYDNLISSQSGAVDLSDSNNYSIRYDGLASGADDFQSSADLRLTEINNDGKPDLIFSRPFADQNGRTDSGSLFVVYNFPHTITVNSINSPLSVRNLTVTGTVTATDSVTTISGVQYQLDSNDPNGTWTACTAADGSFNSTSESYSCSLTGLADGDYTIYIRAYDENTSYSAVASYAVGTFTVDVAAFLASQLAATGQNVATYTIVLLGLGFIFGGMILRGRSYG